MTDNVRSTMHAKSTGKEIEIPGPDHPITISPAEGKVRVTVAVRIDAESAQAPRPEEKGYPPVYCLPRNDADMSFGRRITSIVRTTVIVRTTTFPSADRNRNTPFGRRRPYSCLLAWLFLTPPHRHASCEESGAAREVPTLLNGLGFSIRKAK